MLPTRCRTRLARQCKTRSATRSRRRSARQSTRRSARAPPRRTARPFTSRSAPSNRFRTAKMNRCQETFILHIEKKIFLRVYFRNIYFQNDIRKCFFVRLMTTHGRYATRRTRRSANRRTTTNSRARASRSRSAATRRSAPPGEQITFVRSEFFLHFHFVPVSVNVRFSSLLALLILLEGYVIPPGTSWKIYWLFLLKQLMSVFSLTL